MEQGRLDPSGPWGVGGRAGLLECICDGIQLPPCVLDPHPLAVLDVTRNSLSMNGLMFLAIKKGLY